MGGITSPFVFWGAMNRFFCTLILLAGYTINSPAQTDGLADAWVIKQPPAPWKNTARLLDEDLFLELPLSKGDAVIRGVLARNALIRLNAESLAEYVGKQFRCSPNHQPYLIRAPFGHGGTGKFSVYLANGDVIVNHESLGKTSVVNRSALVVCLSSEPKRIFGIVGIDE